MSHQATCTGNIYSQKYDAV